VGNGLTVPLAQYPKYAELAYNFTKEKLGHPVITLQTYEAMQANLKVCLPLIETCQNATPSCALAQSLCNNGQIGPYEQTGLNPYDFRIPCEVPGLCYDESHVTAFFNDAAIQKALGVDHQTTWATCNYNVNGMFANDWMKQFAEPYVSSQLDAGTRVLIYAGDVDFISNWLGNQAWTLGLPWSGAENFKKAPMKDWALEDGTVAGQARTSGGFTFLRVYDAGHMVPSDQPKSALALLNALIFNTPF
jgi:cathepsin A (carboxypeptidase C)